MKLILRFIFLVFACAYSLHAEAISLSKYSALNCELGNPTIDIIECDSNFYLLQLDVDHNADSTQSFNVFINQDFSGNFYYEELPILIPIDSCVTDFSFETPDCLLNDCIIDGVEYEVVECNPIDSIYYVNVWFDYDNVDSLIVSIYGSGYDWGEFDAWEQPIQLGPFYGAEGVPEQIIQNVNDPSCATEFGIDSPSCFYTDCYLDITEYNIVECNQTDSTFYVELYINHENLAGDSISIYGGGYDWGIFDPNTQPIVVGPYFSGQMDYEIIVADQLDSLCISYVGFGPVDCSDACDIEAVEYEIVDCNPLDSTFYVNVWFEYDNLDSLTVSIFGGGYDWGEFDAWEQPVQLGPFYGDQGVYEVIIQDTYDPECFDVLAVDSPSCLNTDCQLSALEVDVEYCTDSIVFFDASFLVEDPASSVYNKILNGDFIGFGLYSAGSNEQTFEFAIEDPQFGSIYTLELFDEDDVNCATAVEFVLEPCSNACTIDGVDYEVVDCNPLDSTYYVNVWFEYDNDEPLTVSIYGSGYDWGEFDAWEQPILLGPFNGAEGVPEQIIQNVNDPTCATEFGIDSPSCFYSDCFIGDIQITDIFCNDSLFTIDIAFEFDNIGPNGVQIQGGGYNWGNFDPNNQPIELGPFWSEDQIYEVVIYDVANPDCVNYLVFDGPCENNGGCEFIESLWVEDGPYCDSIYCSVAIGVNMNNQGANMLVDVHLDGNSYYDMDPYTLSEEYLEFIHLGADFSTVVICASGTDCCDTLSIEMPGMVEDFVWPGDANSDNIANNLDVLYVGLVNGFDGPERDEMDIEWYNHAASDWDTIFPISEVNIKHADANGDGKINAVDLEAVNENYGLTHGPVDFQPNIGTFEDPPLFVDLPTYLQPGSLVDADVELGSAQFPVDDMYGIAFTIVYPDNIFEGDPVFEPDNSWLGVPNINMYTLHQAQAGLNEVDITLVRNDQNNASGYGRIGNFIGVIDDVLGLQQITITIKDVRAIRNDEFEIPIYLPINSTIISSNVELPAQENIQVYPNPTNRVINIKTDKPADIISIELLNLNGVRMYWQEDYSNQVQIEEFDNGVYFLRIQTQTGLYQTRIMKFD